MIYERWKVILQTSLITFLNVVLIYSCWCCLPPVYQQAVYSVCWGASKYCGRPVWWECPHLCFDAKWLPCLWDILHRDILWCRICCVDHSPVILQICVVLESCTTRAQWQWQIRLFRRHNRTNILIKHKKLWRDTVMSKSDLLLGACYIKQLYCRHENLSTIVSKKIDGNLKLHFVNNRGSRKAYLFLRLNMPNTNYLKRQTRWNSKQKDIYTFREWLILVILSSTWKKWVIIRTQIILLSSVSYD